MPKQIEEGDRARFENKTVHVRIIDRDTGKATVVEDPGYDGGPVITVPAGPPVVVPLEDLVPLDTP